MAVVQELYEKKLVTYPRTDARVLSSAVAKEIGKNLNGLQGYPMTASFLPYISQNQTYKGLEKTRYVNDKQITDHYAIIPTGQGLSALSRLGELQTKMYEVIVRRFLSIFYPPAVYQKLNVTVKAGEERFFYINKSSFGRRIFACYPVFFYEKEESGRDSIGRRKRRGKRGEF